MSRAGGARRLVLDTGGRRLQIEEMRYVREERFGVVSFELPAVGNEMVGEIDWDLEVLVGGHVWRASDESGFQLRFGWRPRLRRVVPEVMRLGSTGFLSLQGEFVKKSVRGVKIGGKTVLAKELVKITEAEIGVSVPQMRRTEGRVEVKVVVMDQSGLESEEEVVVFDSMALEVEATVLESSYDVEKRRVLVPLLCGMNTVPTIVVKVEGMGGVKSVPVYGFAVRTPDMVAGDFRQVYSGESSMVSLDDERLFGENEELETQVITVWVRVAAATRGGERVLFISRQLRRNRIGVTVLASKNGALVHYSRTVLEPSVGRIGHCNDAEDLAITTKWSVNGNEVVDHESDSSTNEDEDRGILMGLGERILLPKQKSVTYEFSVTVSNKSSGELFASGFASGTLQSIEEKRPLCPVVNGGIRFTFVSVENNFSLRCDISNKVDGKEATTLRYTWTCRDTSAKDGVCAETFFPSKLKARASNVSQFLIFARAGEEGKVLKYTVQVKSATRESKRVAFKVTFTSKNKFLFPDAQLETGTGIAPTVAILNGFSLAFNTFDDIVLVIDGPVSKSALDFSLVKHDKQRSPKELLDGTVSNLLINHNGYWSREAPFAAFLGLRAGSLPPGNYTLHGAIGEKAGPDVGSAWVFNIVAPPLVVLSEPTIQHGIINYTTFHASAISIPSSENQFYFSLRLFRSDITTIPDQSHKSFADSSNCLGSCNGFGDVSFIVETSGRFVVVVDMYDPTGTRFIASKTGESYIVVQNAASTTNSINHQLEIENVLRRGDEKAFLAALLKLSPKHSLPQTMLADAMNGLKAISSSPFCNPLQMSRVLNACKNVISHEQIQGLDAFTLVLTIVENCIAQTPPSVPVGFAMMPALTRFYSAATNKLEMLAGNRTDRDGGNEALVTTTSFLDLRAFQDIVVVLSAGLECGATARALVARNTTRHDLDQQADVYTLLQDDYRIGISCFEGQVRSLPPEPALSQLCPTSLQGKVRKRSETAILTSVERHSNLISIDVPHEIIEGPAVQTRLLHWNYKAKRATLVEYANAASEELCLRSRASVFTDYGVTRRDDTLLKKQGRVKCQNGGRVLILEACSNCTQGKAEIEDARRVDELEVDEDGRISVAVEMRVPGHIRLEVNRTLVHICLLDTSLKGEWGGVISVIGCVIVGLSVVAMISAVVGVVYMKARGERQDEYSVPSEAGCEDFGTKSGERAGQTSDWMAGEMQDKCESRVEDEWGEEYVRLSSVESRVGEDDDEDEEDDEEEREEEEGDEEDGWGWMGIGLGGVRRLSLSECEWGEEIALYEGTDRGVGSLESESVECFVVDSYGRAEYEVGRDGR